VEKYRAVTKTKPATTMRTPATNTGVSGVNVITTKPEIKGGIE
jgi:hypothetical protein